MKKLIVGLLAVLLLSSCLDPVYAGEKKLTEKEKQELAQCAVEIKERKDQIKALKEDIIRIIAIANYIKGIIKIEILEVPKEKPRKKYQKKNKKDDK